MIRRAVLVFAVLLPCCVALAADPGNELIDSEAFARNVSQARVLRESRRISEAEFIRMAADPGTVVLDARSERLYRMRHVAGAVNLSFPEFTEATLASVIPAKDTRVLIYCNNNFRGAPESLPVKAIASALNLSTYVSLLAYGYGNVYELGPAIEVASAKLRFEGDELRRAAN